MHVLRCSSCRNSSVQAPLQQFTATLLIIFIVMENLVPCNSFIVNNSPSWCSWVGNDARELHAGRVFTTRYPYSNINLLSFRIFFVSTISTSQLRCYLLTAFLYKLRLRSRNVFNRTSLLCFYETNNRNEIFCWPLHSTSVFNCI